jgi:hypothetical protein
MVTPAEVVCCVAKQNMLLCKQKGCCWHLVYLVWIQVTAQQPITSQKSTSQNVQDCIFSFRIVRQPVQSNDDLHRSVADGARPHRDTQRRPSLFRPLIPRLLRWSDLYRSRTEPQAFLPDLWPRCSGAIFFVSSHALDGRDGYCDKMRAPPDFPRNNRLRSGISHTNMPDDNARK